jgi:serine/threonine-protein kinase HipA
MNLPEGALKDVIRNHFAKIKTMDEMGFLELIGPYVLGRVKYNEILEEKETLKLDEILHNNSENLFEELLEKFAITSGVSGVQPKLLLTAQNKTTMNFEHYIVKSWTNEYPQLAINEYFCMKAIQNANLQTEEFYLSEDLTMFVCKRFDVNEDNSYLGFEDMCVLTGRGTDEKYNGSYEEIAKVIKEVIPIKNRKNTLKSFFKALIMNHLLQNGDGHLKNYGILYNKDFTDSFFAPIFDVITTTLYIKKDIPALRLSDGKLWWKNKTYKNFAKNSCMINSKEYEQILIECKEAIIKTKKEIDDFKTDKEEVKLFLEELKAVWMEEIK